MMNASADRILPPTEALFIPGEQIASIPITQVEGQPFARPPVLQLLMVTPDMHCIKLFRAKGSIDPEHRHDDLTTVCCLCSGRLKLWIGDQTFIAEPGDVWVHRQGVAHRCEALEDSLQISINAPASRTW